MALINMWPFSTRARPEVDRVDPLTTRLAELERQVKRLEVEWTEWYDKYRRLYARIAKRQERDEQAPQDAPEPTNGPVGYSGTAHLSSRFRR